MINAIFSGTNELVDVEEIIKYFLPLILKNSSINDYFSFRCPICFLPVTFAYYSNQAKQSHFRHFGELKDSDCPQYTGKFGDNISGMEGDINFWKDFNKLFSDYFSFQPIWEWKEFKNFKDELLLPPLYREIISQDKTRLQFLWLFPILHFLDFIQNSQKENEIKQRINELKKFGQNIIVLYYSEFKKVDPLKESYLIESFSNFLSENNILIVESMTRPTLIFPSNRIWGNFKENNNITVIKDASFLFLQEVQFSFEKVKQFFLVRDSLLKRKNKEILLGYYDIQDLCPDKSCNNPYNLVIALNISGKHDVRRMHGLRMTQFLQFRCSRCSKIIFDLPDWKAFVKKTSGEAYQIREGDSIIFIYGDYKNKKGKVLKKFEQNLMISVLIENNKIINQSIYFAKKLTNSEN